MRRITSVFLAAACLLPLSCGEDDGSDRDEAREAIAAFEAAVTAEGFTPSEEEDDDTSFEFTSQECRELDAALSNDEDLEGQTADEDSQEFGRTSDNGEESVQASVTIADADALQARLDIFADDRTAPCLEEGVTDAFAQQEAELGLELLDLAVDLERRDLGDDAVLVQISALIATDGGQLPFVIDMLAVRSGRRGVIVMTTAIGAPPSLDPQAIAGTLLPGAPA